MLIGRDDEICRIRDLVSQLGPESGFALLVSGDAGMGKSALLDAVASAADVQVLRASGLLSEGQVAFAGLQELLAPVLSYLDVLPARMRSALLCCLGVESGATDEMASFVAVTMLLAAAAEKHPLLCLIDDAHWLDESSTTALLFAARRHPDGVGFVFAVRGEAPTQLDQPWLPRLVLNPLGEVDSRAVLAEYVPSLTGIEVDRVLRASEGCPLALREFGHAVYAGSGTVEGAPLPISARLEAVFGQAVRSLPEHSQRGLVVLAADHTGSARVIGLAVEAFTGDPAALDPAYDAGLVIGDGTQVRFKHPLVRAAAYHSASRRVQRAAHRLLADLLVDQPEHAAWQRAAACDAPDEAAAEALVETAELARRRGGYAAESRALERAARLTPDPTSCIVRLSAAASAALLAGKHAHAEKLLREVVARARDPVVLADAEHERAQIAFWRDGRRLPTVPVIAARVATVDRRRAARLLSFDLVSLISDYQAEAALPIAVQALQLLDGAVEPFEVAFRAAHVLIMAGHTAAGAELTTRVVAAVETAGNATAAVNIAQPCIWLERYDQARSLLSSAAAALRSVDALWMLGHALVGRAELERRVGDLTAARLAAAEALALAEQLAEPMQEAEALVQLAAVEAELAQPVECLAHAQRATRLAASRECGKGELVMLVAAAAGQLALTAGRPGEAVTRLAGPVTRALDSGIADPAVLPCVADLIEAYAQDGRAAEAQRLYEWLAVHAERCDRAWARQAALRCAVLLEDRAAAREALADSLAAHDAGAWVQTGRGWLIYGAAQRRAGQRAGAGESLRRAHAIFVNAGALGWADRAAAELRALGARVAATGRDPLNSLTPQEARVAQLVADGARNREVAATLFVTPKTVETHLAAVYRKLSVRSRAELARHLAHTQPTERSQGFA